MAMPPPSAGVGAKSVADRPTRVDGSASRPSESNARVAVAAMAAAASSTHLRLLEVAIVVVARSPPAPPRRVDSSPSAGSPGFGLDVREFPVLPACQSRRCVDFNPARYSSRRCRGCLRAPPVLHQPLGQLAGEHPEPPVHAARVVHGGERLERVHRLDPFANVRHDGLHVLPRRDSREPRRSLGLQPRRVARRGVSSPAPKRGTRPRTSCPCRCPRARSLAEHPPQRRLHLLAELTPKPLIERIGSDSIISVTALRSPPSVCWFVSRRRRPRASCCAPRRRSW